MMSPKPIEEIGTEKVFVKLGKSLVTYQDLKAGDTLSLENLSGRIFNEQIIPVRESNRVIGKVLKRDIKKGDPIFYEDIIGL